jgi:hypothetical protein
VTRHLGTRLHRNPQHEGLTQERLARGGDIAAVRVVHEGQHGIHPEAADQLRLTLHHVAIPLLILAPRSIDRAPLVEQHGEEHEWQRDRDHEELERQRVVDGRQRLERPVPVHRRADREEHDGEHARAHPAEAEAQRGPQEERQGRVQERRVGVEQRAGT